MVESFVFGDKFNQLAIATAYIWKKITLVLISGEIDTLGSLNINTFSFTLKVNHFQKTSGIWKLSKTTDFSVWKKIKNYCSVRDSTAVAFYVFQTLNSGKI